MGAEIFNFIESQREIGSTADLLKVSIFRVHHCDYKTINFKHIFIAGEIRR